QTAVLIGLIVVGLTIPLLIARAWDEDRCAASTLRWNMALAFAVGSVPLWGREAVVQFARRFGVATEPDERSTPEIATRLVRGVLLAVAAGLPILLTLTVLGQLLVGEKPLGPGSGSFFHRIGFTASHGIPLAFVAAALVGHALRERSSGFAFSAGLVVKLLVAGGFAVGVVTAGRPFDENAWVELGQRVTLTAGVWALGWLLVSRWMGRFREVDLARIDQLPSQLWKLQFGLALLGNVWRIGAAAV